MKKKDKPKNIRKNSVRRKVQHPNDKMTMIHDVLIPYRPGSCCHALLCILLENKNKFVTWEKIFKSLEQYITMFGGSSAWKNFAKKSNNENLLKRIKSNANALASIGKKTGGYKLHREGMAVYLFSDGMLIRTGGKYVEGKGRKTYDIKFTDGTGFQIRNRGKSMGYREYKDLMGGTIEDEEI